MQLPLPLLSSLTVICVLGACSENKPLGSTDSPVDPEPSLDAGSTMDATVAPPTEHEKCGEPYEVDARDDVTTPTLEEWVSSKTGNIDLAVPSAIRDWMTERQWQGAHDGWHLVRRCGLSGPGGAGPGEGPGGGFPGFDGGFPDDDGGLGPEFPFPPPGTNGAICETHPNLIAEHQECTDAEDGYQFVVMHRHMIEGLRQAFPKNAMLFEPFPEFPFDAEDVPEQWRGRWGTGWSPEIIETAQLLEDIENHIDEFATEGDLGQFIQCGPMMSGATGVHGALHAKWSVNDSPFALGSSVSNIDNYMFWKLHGWIDEIWERYRVAKGLTPDEPKLKKALIQQCEEMHVLGHAIAAIDDDDTDAGALPEEHGYFHENVRPIIERSCSGCHGPKNPEGLLSLGGQISSTDVVSRLVGVNSVRGGQFKLVVAGNPDQSWLYLKVAGLAAQAGCTGSDCNAQVMPPLGQVTLKEEELSKFRQWILDGAPAPTQ